MEESRKCIYCNEIMTYGSYIQVMSKIIKRDKIWINKKVKYMLYGWRCQLKNDDCDTLLNYKNNDKNNFNVKEAEEELDRLLNN